MTLAALDTAPDVAAAAALERCCGARAWVAALLAARPYRTAEALHAAADAAFAHLTREDWLEAFEHHPRIGDLDALRSRFAATAAWAGGEQSGAAGADARTLERLADGNRAYEARFGYRFIVCATGLGAGEMLARLEARLGNEPARELAIAGAEQTKITHIRIDKLLEEP
jgi:2-oxo-4-hydroxy-4-carboxy-5-ureidoimidazoline decarboxylase